MFLKLGSDGPEVEALQHTLNALGESLIVDGRFGPLTEMAVIRFQTAKGLPRDGKVGEKTWEALGVKKAPSSGPRSSGDPNLRVSADGPVIKGIDVSHHNGHIKWEELTGRVNFAFIKATESTGYVDPTFSLNWIEAKVNKVLRGAYHFFQPDKDVQAQIDHFTKVVKDQAPADLPPVFDFEVHGSDSKRSQVDKALEWLKGVEDALKVRPIIYLSPGFMNDLGNPQAFYDYPLWIANYGIHDPSVPPPWKKWQFWQYSETGKVVGIKGNVDMNWFNGTIDDLTNL